MSDAQTMILHSDCATLEGYIISNEICDLICFSTHLWLFISISHRQDLNNCKYIILCVVPLEFQNLLVVKSSNIDLQNG